MARSTPHIFRSLLTAALFMGRAHATAHPCDTDTVPVRSLDGFMRPSSLALPMAGLAYGCLKPAIGGIGRLDDRIWTALTPARPYDGFPVETVLQWTPTASVYLMDAAGVRLRHRFRDHVLLDAGSLVVAGGAGWVMRRISAGMPDFGLKEGTEFPSGHATNAFRGAELLRLELRGRSPVLSWSGYAVATLVSFLRMRHGQHQWSEVVAGAGLGVLSTRSVYWLTGRLGRRSSHSSAR